MDKQPPLPDTCPRKQGKKGFVAFANVQQAKGKLSKRL
jgi:hypothetical protein